MVTSLRGTALLMEVRLGSLAQLLLQLVLADSATLDLDVEVNLRRSAQTERVSDLLEVELIYIEDVSLFVRSVGLEVGPVAVLSRAVKVVIAFNQLHKLLLNVGQFTLRELVFIGLNFRLLKVA